jgi:hypothetical protein
MVVAGHDVDRRILRIDELEMKELRPSANASVEVFVLEGERESGQCRVEADGRRQIGGPQLCYHTRYLHPASVTQGAA